MLVLTGFYDQTSNVNNVCMFIVYKMIIVMKLY